MSEIIGKYIIHFEIKLKTNLHIGSGKADMDTDALCVRNSMGDIIIKGSSLAGIFRCTLERLFGEKDENIQKFFGRVENTGGNTISEASSIYFEDAVLKSNGSPNTDIRDGVGINRRRLSAQDGCKYDKETVFKDALFPCTITIDYTSDNKPCLDTILQYLKICFYNLDKGLTPIGGNSSRGLGYCEIPSAQYCLLDFTQRGHLSDYLLNDFYDRNVFPLIKDKDNLLYFREFTFNEKLTIQPVAMHFLNCCIKLYYELKTVEPMLINGTRTNDEDVDLQFIKTKGKYIIPGSSVKGPLRARAETILRTMSVQGVCDPVSGMSCFDQKKPAVCKACSLFGSPLKKSKILFSDLELAGGVKTKYFDHNKIDRFTGGTIESALFDENLIFDAVFRGVIIIENPDTFDLKLLIHLLKDLYLEDIRIGHGKTKGYGKVKGLVKKLELFTTQVSTLNGKVFDAYNIPFGREEGVYRILEIDNLYDMVNQEKYKILISEIEKCEWQV